MTNRQAFEKWVAYTLTVPVMRTQRYDCARGAYKDERMEIAWKAYKRGLLQGSSKQKELQHGT